MKHLTQRELEVLKLIADGKRQKDVASQLNISVPTVRSHVANITNKLQANSLADLIKYALKIGIAN